MLLNFNNVLAEAFRDLSELTLLKSSLHCDHAMITAFSATRNYFSEKGELIPRSLLDASPECAVKCRVDPAN